jgi:hypothetical protein
MAKNETALTEQEFERQARREAIEALRQWRVTVGKAEHVVMAHSAALGSGGVLMFYTYVGGRDEVPDHVQGLDRVRRDRRAGWQSIDSN